MKLVRPFVALVSIGAVVLTGTACSPPASEGGSGTQKIRFQHSAAAVEAQGTLTTAAASFNSSQTECEVTTEFVPFDQLRQSLLSGIAAGNTPDLVHTTTLQSGLEMNSLGGWADLSDHMTDSWKQEHGFVEGAFDELGAFGIPVMQSAEGVIFYDVPAMQAAGVKVPELTEAMNWDQFTDAAKKMTANGRYGFADRATAGFNLMKAVIPYLWSEGTDIVVKDGDSWKSGLSTPEGKKALRRYLELGTTAGIKPPGITGWGYAEAVNAWKKDEIAMLNIGDWFVSQTGGKLGSDWDVMLFPTEGDIDPFTIRTFNYLNIPEQSDHKDCAFKYADHLLKDEVLGEWSYNYTQTVPLTEGALKHPKWQESAFLQDRLIKWNDKGKSISTYPNYVALWEGDLSAPIQDALLKNISIDKAIAELDAIIAADIKSL